MRYSGLLPLLIALTVLFAAPDSATAQTDTEPLCRLGVNIYKEDATRLDLSPLRVGWYVDGWANSANTRPRGIEYALIIQVEASEQQGVLYHPSGAELDAAIDAHPGAVWTIGNEPDRRHFQNDMLPELYARAYHDLHTYLKTRDPTARVLAGGIVQPTPVRIEYLDLVLAAYETAYGTPLPADGWNVHNFILNERSCDYYQDTTICWGADIPPGVDAIDGMIVGVEDHDRMDLFTAQVERFRRWMRDNGYRNTPLYLAEYGILFPENYGFPYPPSRVNAFMDATFDLMLTATDPEIGCPQDGNRLVQRMAWYAAVTDAPTNGLLYANSNPTEPDDPVYVLTSMGEHFRNYAARIEAESDLKLLEFRVTSPAASPTLSTPVTLTLTALVANQGNIQAQTIGSIDFYAGMPAQGGTLVASSPISLSGCGEHSTVSVVWPSVTPDMLGSGEMVARLTSTNFPDAQPDNDSATTYFFFGDNRLYLPVLRHP